MRGYWFVLMCLVLGGCRTKYVPTEVVRYDSLIIERMMKDSVYVRDSVYIREKGDTVFKDKFRDVYIYKERVDTCYVYRVEYEEIPVPVERELNWWEKLKLNFGGWMVLAVAAYVVYRMVRWLVVRTRKE